MAEQFNYSSVLAPYMRQLLTIKESTGLSALRIKWILKEIDDFANHECLEDPHIKEHFFLKWRKTRVADCGSTMYYKYSIWHQLTTLMTRCGCECFIPKMPKGGATDKPCGRGCTAVNPKTSC